MSTFTRFDGDLHTHPAPEASKILGSEHRWIDPGFIYYLDADNDEYVAVESGYLSDGASVPKLFQWLIHPWGKHGQCAVLHDKLCETWKTSKRTLTRKQVDEIFFESMGVAGVNVFRRMAIELAVTGYRLWSNPSGPSDASAKQALTDEYNKR